MNIYLNLIIILFSGIPYVAYAQTPPAGSVGIHDIRYAGSGCPTGTVATNLSQDRQAFTVLFDSFYVEAFGNKLADQKTCQLHVDLDYPHGWTFTIFSVDTRGYASLHDRNAQAKIKTHYKFQRGGALSVENKKLRGPLELDYHYRSEIGLGRVKWAPCSGNPRANGLLLTTEIAVEIERDSEGLMTVDSQDGELKQTFGIAWKRCSNGQGNGRSNASH